MPVSVFAVLVPTIGLAMLYGWWRGKDYNDHFVIICPQALVAGFIGTLAVIVTIAVLSITGVIP
jgi:hypothetical protein